MARAYRCPTKKITICPELSAETKGFDSH